VSAWNATTGAWSGASVTDANGLYSIMLYNGPYKLLVESGTSTYPAQWFGGSSQATATPVTLGAANQTQNLTAN
jgi:hypothetical protein